MDVKTHHLLDTEIKSYNTFQDFATIEAPRAAKHWQGGLNIKSRKVSGA